MNSAISVIQNVYRLARVVELAWIDWRKNSFYPNRGHEVDYRSIFTYCIAVQSKIPPVEYMYVFFNRKMKSDTVTKSEVEGGRSVGKI